LVSKLSMSQRDRDLKAPLACCHKMYDWWVRNFVRRIGHKWVGFRALLKIIHALSSSSQITNFGCQKSAMSPMACVTQAMRAGEISDSKLHTNLLESQSIEPATNPKFRLHLRHETAGRRERRTNRSTQRFLRSQQMHSLNHES
jgi:hypothetical protein